MVKGICTIDKQKSHKHIPSPTFLLSWGKTLHKKLIQWSAKVLLIQGIDFWNVWSTKQQNDKTFEYPKTLLVHTRICVVYLFRVNTHCIISMLQP